MNLQRRIKKTEKSLRLKQAQMRNAKAQGWRERQLRHDVYDLQDQLEELRSQARQQEAW
jgi:hypothetical protein